MTVEQSFGANTEGEDGRGPMVPSFKAELRQGVVVWRQLPPLRRLGSFGATTRVGSGEG
jgi:hypothetical protein